MRRLGPIVTQLGYCLYTWNQINLSPSHRLPRTQTMPHCSGCSKTFPTTRGYHTHFSKTTHEPCLKIREDAEADLPSSDSSTDEENFGQDLWGTFPHGQTRFSGDFFGDNYADEDFGYVYDSDAERGYASGNLDDSDSGDELGDPAVNDLADAARAQDEDGWEPERRLGQDAEMQDVQDIPESRPPPTRETRVIAEDRFHVQPIIEKFPGARAGEVISKDRTQSAEERYRAATNLYAPFASKMDWEVARWAKLRGSGSTAFTDLLKIDGVRDVLGLSYGTSAQLNQVIDKNLPGRPQFTRSEVVVDFAPYLFVLPERHYADKDKTIRLYHNMHTAKWWWSTQKEVEKDNPGATIIPILLSSDKTQLTMFGNRSAYPVYMTIGNIPKEIRRKTSRRAYVLLAYLPTSRLNHITNDASRRRTLANLFHACLSYITAPLRDAGISGLPMASGDGQIRPCHPIVACYIGDYPEQVLVTCVKTGECPTCDVVHGKLGDGIAAHLRHLDNILDALDTLDQGGTVYAKACTAAGIKPVVHPFWEKLPYTNIFTSITSDILHQLYQGIVKHLISWIKETFGEAEIDARCRRLPPNHCIRVFLKGISNLNRVTGKEHDQIARFLLGIIIDLPIPGGYSPFRLIRSVRAILDFVYLAQYPLHSTESLALLANARERFHENKGIFVDLGIRNDFNLPKVHSWDHYELNITFYGTSDNYNTEHRTSAHRLG
ncbi:hypothetical protein B0H10DRAFT_2440216 [Mycena sp. CBHHK59/15]|nr:hypothetical protein B0H10DRAFT_2440216 [Mycena sp. CBHHK59/15]